MVPYMAERWFLKWLKNGFLHGYKMLFAQKLKEILLFLIA
jgi:hypothetical protein